MDRVLGTSFYMPAGLVVAGIPLHYSGGGQPLLWQHLFWFLAHPEVYVPPLPAMGHRGGKSSPTTRRKPIFGYPEIVGSMIFIEPCPLSFGRIIMFIAGHEPWSEQFSSLVTNL